MFEIRKDILNISATEFISFIFLCVGILFVAVDFANWGGWLFFGLSFVVLLSERSIKDSLSLYLACVFVLFIYHIIPFLYHNYSDYFNFINSVDALKFHREASAQILSEVQFFQLGHFLYINFLTLLYAANHSSFFGQEVNVFAFAVFLVYLTKIMRILKMTNNKVFVILAFIVLPSYLFILPQLLREALELLFFTMSIYYGLSFYLRDSKFIDFLLALVSILLLSSLHRALFLYVPVFLFLILLWPFSWRKYKFRSIFFVGLLFSAVIGFIFVIVPHAGVAGLQKIPEFNFAFLQKIRADIPIGNMNYFIEVDYQSISGVASGVFRMLYYYLFTPMFWSINSLYELFFTGYVFIRVILLMIILLSYRTQTGLAKEIIVWFLAVYFSFSMLWAIGVGNYGTAIRHQILTDWILVLLAISRIDLLSLKEIVKKNNSLVKRSI